MLWEGELQLGWYLGARTSAATVARLVQSGVHAVVESKAWDASAADVDVVIGMAARHGITLTPEDVLLTKAAP